MARAYNIEQKENESDLQYYKRLAKAADQRLVRLEQLAASGEDRFKNVEKYAYQSAIRDIQSYPGAENFTRFNTKPPAARQLFREKIADMRRFLSAPTSTKSGIINVYQKRVNTLNKKYGTSFTWQQFADFMDSDEGRKIFGDYGSDTAFRAIGKVQAWKEKELTDKIKSNKKIRTSALILDQVAGEIEKLGIF